MECKHFGECGSCNLYNLDYQSALKSKKEEVEKLLAEFFNKELSVYDSKSSAHRARAEFKIWHKDNSCYYAMTNLEKNGVVLLDECPKVIDAIANKQYRVLNAINKSSILKEKLFSIELLGAKSGELLVTLIYHKKLDSAWEQEAKELEKQFNISIIGRARKQKIVLSQEYITEVLEIENKKYSYRYYEGGFTQPNPYINEKMIAWTIEQVKENGGDLIELYCGLGNFTLPLSRYFNSVLATEISKNSIKAAKENCILNNISNISFIRLNAYETAQALAKTREFRRLKDINLEIYNFSTILVDPPRAGLDEYSINLAKEFKNIVYISCNPQTLARDLETLSKSHKVVNGAIFDQFPYTNHIESGVYLERI